MGFCIIAPDEYPAQEKGVFIFSIFSRKSRECPQITGLLYHISNLRIELPIGVGKELGWFSQSLFQYPFRIPDLR